MKQFTGQTDNCQQDRQSEHHLENEGVSEEL